MPFLVEGNQFEKVHPDYAFLKNPCPINISFAPVKLVESILRVKWPIQFFLQTMNEHQKASLVYLTSFFMYCWWATHLANTVLGRERQHVVYVQLYHLYGPCFHQLDRRPLDPSRTRLTLRQRLPFRDLSMKWLGAPLNVHTCSYIIFN